MNTPFLAMRCITCNSNDSLFISSKVTYSSGFLGFNKRVRLVINIECERCGQISLVLDQTSNV